MGIAYTFPFTNVVHAEIDATSGDCLRNGLHTVVTMAGWVVDREIENGRVYILTSPQDASLQCKVKIQDNDWHATGVPATIGSNVIDIRFLSMSEEFESQIFVLGYRNPGSASLFGYPPRRIRIHATPCQIFTYLPGGWESGSAVMGGIPFIDPNALEGTSEPCADEDSALKTTQAWWACGDLATNYYVYGVESFRTGWVAEANATLHNINYETQSQNGGDAALLRLTPPNKPVVFYYSYGASNFAAPLMMRWLGTEEPLCLDAFIAWNTQHPVKIRGQIWDAFIRTRHVAFEEPLLFDGLEFFAYTSHDLQMSGSEPFWYQSSDICTLYLRDSGLVSLDCEGQPSVVNYAY